MNMMTRPQLYIWYAKTLNREHREKVNEQKSAWQRAANILAQLENTAMGSKGDGKAENYMPDFQESLTEVIDKVSESTEDYIEKAKQAGVTPPSDY